jgi:3-carboxy-cis,cis-muconate cycloisomerase
MSVMFTSDAMRAIFDDRTRIQRMLDFEAALARVEGALHVIPAAAAGVIGSCCLAELYDYAALAQAARQAGNLAIPLVSALTREVGQRDGAAKGYVHWGATSQDVIDTALVLQLRDALDDIEGNLGMLVDALTVQIERHRHTPMVGRTWLQQAVPVTLGLKLAGTLSALTRDRARLADMRGRLVVLQFGGAAGTLASLGGEAVDVESALAAELGLAIPDMPWHTQRDRLCELAAVLGLITATLGKLARDVALLAQTEVAEAFEPAGEGRGGSSTLPQKRNPVGAAIAIAAAVRAPGLVATMLSAAVQEHERGLGNWPAEWETLPEIVQLAAGSIEAMHEVITGLDVDSARMRANLENARGQNLAEAVQMALARTLGRDVAHKKVSAAAKRAAAERVHLKEALAEDPEVREILDDAALTRLLEPTNYLGATNVFIDRVLASR